MNDAAFRRVEIIKVLKISDTRIKGKDLGKRFGVSKKTIEKDIAKLEDLGFLFDKVNGPSGGYLLIQPVPEIDFVLCREEKEKYTELVRMQNLEDNQTESAKRLLAYFRELMIKDIFS